MGCFFWTVVFLFSDDDNDDAVDYCHENAGANNLAVSEIQMNDDTFLTSVQACCGQFTNSLGGIFVKALQLCFLVHFITLFLN